MTIDDAAAYLRVPEFVVPMLVRENDDLVIEGAMSSWQNVSQTGL
ncbi:hypothetical protein ACEQPO_07890 [Bacillus sp. SL00103]